ncbi:hypothetical protein ACMHYJ_05260 [Castellaniella hirudinis]|uniref:hypothetical protein n=1 Tax=Castellaniella hirudinis TaxID=1144617 RepID=UPI0039C1FF60
MTLPVKEYAKALDSLAFICLHGDRQQQIESAAAAQEILKIGGHPVKRAHMLRFDVQVRAADGLHCWTAITHNSIDALLGALEKFEGQQVAVTVKAEGRK